MKSHLVELWTSINFTISPFSLGVFLYGGSVTVSQTAVMAQMNLRPAHLVTAPLASSSVKMATVPTLVSSAMDSHTALTAQMRMPPSAVWQ